MKLNQVVSEAFIRIAMSLLFGLIVAWQTCLAQTAGEEEISKEGQMVLANSDPSVTTSGPQASQSISNLMKRFSSRGRGAPVREDQITFNLFGKHVNAISGGITHGAGLSFGLEFTTADLIKWVEFRASLLTSTILYRRFEGIAYFPKIGDEQTHAEVWFSYLRRTEEDFYGIGPRSPKDFQTNFDLERRSYNATFYRDFTDRFQAGVYARVANSGTFNGEDDKDIPMDQLFSGNPAVIPITRWAPGFQTNTKILSYGVYGEYNRRDNGRGLTKGIYLYGRFASADGLNYDNNPVFQDYGWLETELDARAYFPLLSDKTSLAIRAYSDLKSPKGGSQIPFYEMPFLGGRSHLRGFPNNRFRGNKALLFFGEVRQTMWAQNEHRGLDVFGFVDVGQVWGDNRSKTDPAILQNKDFDSGNWRTGSGGGIQYRLSKSFAFRVELGHSNERNLLYFSFSRGF
jgi:hypothetical protein